MRKQSPGSHSRGAKHMWHEDGTRRQRRGCPVGHLLWSCSQGQEAPQKPHRKNGIFKCQGPGQRSFPPGAPRHIPDTELQTLSAGLPESILNWSVTPCGAFVGVRNETARVEAAAAWLARRPKIITLPHLGPSPRAAPLRSKQGAHYQTASSLEGLSTRPEETYWHSTAGVMLL